jgi:hypothetical protein
VNSNYGHSPATGPEAPTHHCEERAGKGSRRKDENAVSSYQSTLPWVGGNPSVNDGGDICDADSKHSTLHNAADGLLDDL